MTLGFDPEKKQYVGTWVDSMTGKLWQYTGKVEGNRLTLETEGICPMQAKPVRFRDTLELIDADHKTYTSAMMGEDGKWLTVMTSKAERIK
jgi:hypothetical protein